MKRILEYNKFVVKNTFYKIDTSYNYEWVKTETIWEYKEFDRSEHYQNIEKLEDKLSTEGFTEPLILHYSHKYKTAYLTEGNHRLLAAKNLGIQYIPIRVTIDGVQKKDAEPVLGYYSESEKVDPRVPSEIGIPNCIDKTGKPVESESRIIEEDELNYDEILSKYEDIAKFEKIEDGCYNIWVSMNWWHIHNIMNSKIYDNLECIKDNDSDTFFKEYDRNAILDFLDGDYFTKNMKKFLGLDENMFYNDEYNYFWDTFTESKYFSNYINEIKRVIWEFYKSKNLNTLKFAGFHTPYDGVIDWWFEKPNINELFNVKGIIIKHELIETYDTHVLIENDKFINVLKDAYEHEIGDEWKVDNLIGKIKPEMLSFENIFK